MPTTFYCTRCLEPLGPQDTGLQECIYCHVHTECCHTCATSIWTTRHKDTCEDYHEACTLHPTTFYNEVAPALKPAVRFAARNKLPLTTGGDSHVPVLWPLFLLVFTGQDSDANLRLLLGPCWRCYTDVVIAHEETRIELLLDPEAGSPSFVSNRRWTNQLVADGVVAAGAGHRVVATVAEREVMGDVSNTRELIKMGISSLRLKRYTAITRDDLVAMFSSMLTAASFERYWRTIKMAASMINQGLP